MKILAHFILESVTYQTTTNITVSDARYSVDRALETIPIFSIARLEETIARWRSGDCKVRSLVGISPNLGVQLPRQDVKSATRLRRLRNHLSRKTSVFGTHDFAKVPLGEFLDCS